MDKKILNDTKTAYQYLSDKDLKKNYTLFYLMSSPFFSKVGIYLMKFALSTKLPVKNLIKNTIFQQFCGGEALEQSNMIIKRLSKFGVKTILDYSAEGKVDKDSFTFVTRETVRSIEKSGSDIENIPFAVFKMSGIVSKKLLKAVQMGKKLTNDQIEDLNLTLKRLEQIALRGVQLNVPVMIDAEEYKIQMAIDKMVVDLMKKYNKKAPIIHNTYQLYLKDGLDRLKRDVELGKKEGFYVGVKLVRGAYMEMEREEASINDQPSPIHNTKRDTDKAYNEALSYLIDNIEYISLVAGTHNMNSTLFLTELMEKKGIKSDDKRVYFSQLYGMSDNLTFNLAKYGYNTAKYLPYGPVDMLVPYLFRRAQENRSIQGQTGREFMMIKQEFLRRKGE